MTKKQPFNFRLLGLIALVLGFSHYFPKTLVSILGTENPWTSYFYMYGLGLVCFGIGLMVILKQGALNLHRGTERFWFHVLLGGFVFFSTLHGVWIILAIHYPFKGGM
ncbi:MAG: hypothetical protein H6624_17180 [Bdellovibrionaceae bacterium]|nr:hypothetical protein [Bdellovibrionales bacterium]MCB9086081.1 hypothetical protein [Pseudobdellovibrionaceae bacterium]